MCFAMHTGLGRDKGEGGCVCTGMSSSGILTELVSKETSQTNSFMTLLHKKERETLCIVVMTT